MAKKLNGKPISPQQMIAQWRHLPHKFQVNVWSFEIQAGRAAVSIFKESFDLKRLNSAGSMPWRPRRDKKTHPLLNETSSLKNSIKWKHISEKSNPSGVRIYTDPNGFKHTKRHRGFCYAAVHNAKSGTYTYGRTGVASVQRQYIGHSSVLKNKLMQLSAVIFTGFPK
jgi:hypothetical protein